MAKSEKPKPSNAYIKYTSLGFQMLATILIGLGIGYWIDKKTGRDDNLFTAIFSFIFVLIAMYQIIKEVLRPQK